MYNAKGSKNDIHQDVTNNIIEMLDQVDMKDYQPPFANLAALGIPENPTTSKRYQGINILALWFNQKSKEFQSNKWASFKQWKEAGSHVKKGEKGTRIIFYKTLVKDNENGNSEDEKIKIPMLKQYVVFNASQVEGYEDSEKNIIPECDKVNRLNLVDDFCKNTKAEIRTGGDRAYYTPIGDYINMPETSLFYDSENTSATENYYSVLLHELTHWTGAKSRLNRDWEKSQKPKEDYAFEELVAELGSAFLCAQHNINQSHPKNHALYIKSWLKALRNDKSFIFKAAAQAAKASDYLNELQEYNPS
ncbi:MAG: zincin-like metallopeptidase domain-containing protein [Cyclobacteriaceae bacterium]